MGRRPPPCVACSLPHKHRHHRNCHPCSHPFLAPPPLPHYHRHCATLGARGVTGRPGATAEWNTRRRPPGTDLALHDVVGKKLGVPVYQLLGGKHRDWFDGFATCFLPVRETLVVGLPLPLLCAFTAFHCFLLCGFTAFLCASTACQRLRWRTALTRERPSIVAAFP